MLVQGHDFPVCLATVSATNRTYCQSAEPFSSDGVPVAINIKRPCFTPLSASVVKRRCLGRLYFLESRLPKLHHGRYRQEPLPDRPIANFKYCHFHHR